MFFTLTHDQIQFCYGSKRWQYSFNEIVELGLLKKKKSYLLENGAFIAITAIAYYCMVFSNLMEMYYIVPTLLCYTIIIISRFHASIDAEYYVIVKDVYKKEIRVKIKNLDRPVIGKQIDQYLNLEFDRMVHKQKSNTQK
ncbi:hypothetical protein D0809_18225 [Flavobacterium circumlabens]|uniref:Uncharacterized protein n=1 Tax=Flavobacterium circumlabens TaxID=2133765 RepID=A0A4Y7U952_9FLAO|nr:hypothetical protein [Flavobacterium circumlabens]TCN54607.1 hypothetical protein EV142_107107 [Flavobacterium circumlabens]TEB42804.1 hypothetical protein D0809_18225 [Flavobacterium circumlabens]